MDGTTPCTAALQLLYHLEGDALNVALLGPESRRASRVGLVDALTAHYGSTIVDGLLDFFFSFSSYLLDFEALKLIK